MSSFSVQNSNIWPNAMLKESGELSGLSTDVLPWTSHSRRFGAEYILKSAPPADSVSCLGSRVQHAARGLSAVAMWTLARALPFVLVVAEVCPGCGEGV